MKRKLLLADGQSDGYATTDPTGPAEQENAGALAPASVETVPVGDIAHGVGDEVAALNQALAALRESEARYRTLTDLSSDWYWEHDEHQRFTWLSRKNGEQSEIPRDMFIGKTRREVPGLCWDEPELAALEALTATRRPFRDFEIGRTYQNGPRQYLKLSGEAMFDATGRFVGYRGVGRDITGPAPQFPLVPLA